MDGGSCASVVELETISTLEVLTHSQTPTPWPHQTSIATKGPVFTSSLPDFPDYKSLRIHQDREHRRKEEKDTSIGRALKRMREGDALMEQEKRQRLEEAHVSAEAVCSMSEPAPV